MRIRTLAIAAVLILGLTAGPATAAPSGSKKHPSETWAGQVVREKHHFDYRGSSCPTSADTCIMVLANFRIVPLNPQAAAGLRRVAGGSAKLVGYQTPASDGAHNGVLHVRRVKKA